MMAEEEEEEKQTQPWTWGCCSWKASCYFVPLAGQTSMYLLKSTLRLYFLMLERHHHSWERRAAQELPPMVGSRTIADTHDGDTVSKWK